MFQKIESWCFCTVVLCLATLAGNATEPLTSLDDAQLSAVYAQGFNITIDFDIDLATTDPNSVVVTGEQLKDMQNLVLRNVSPTGNAAFSRYPTMMDAGGNVLPGMNSITNALNITDHAMENAKSLLTVFALNGDVALGLNMNIIVNPGDTPFTVTQMNLNWANVLLSGTSLTPPTL